MGEIVKLWADQLWKLSVVWPAWLLTPEGRATLFSRATFWKILLAVVFLVALAGLSQTLPADIALLAAGDAAGYLEIAGILWLTGAAVFMRGALRAVARWGLRGLARFGRLSVRRARRTARRRRLARRTPPANDDLEAGVWALAA